MLTKISNEQRRENIVGMCRAINALRRELDGMFTTLEAEDPKFKRPQNYVGPCCECNTENCDNCNVRCSNKKCNSENWCE